MRKFFAVVIFFAAFFVACEQPTGNVEEPPLPTLTIRNESSHDLSDVSFGGISFATSGNSLPVSAHATRQLTAENIDAAGRITFTRNDIGIALRTDVISIGNHDFTFTFIDSTAVEELANTANRRPLGQISFLSQLAVERGGLPVARGDIVNLGDSVTNTPRQTVFNIRNTGVGRLLFGTIEPVQISNDTYNVFSVVQPFGAEIAPDASMPFTINFTPRASQTYTATVTIRSNDQSGDYVFTITAIGVSPQPIATVVHNGTTIQQNGTIYAGEVLVTLSENITIGIGNIGTEVLTVDTEGITITGTHAAAFSLLTSPGGSISVRGQSSFIVQFKPTAQGENNAILTIPTNDVSRNPIIVFLRGTALMGSPVPELRQGDTVILNNALASHDFGQVIVGANTSLMFTIKNTGNVVLELNGNPVIESTNPVFSIPTQPVNTSIAPGNEVSFILRYEPTTEGEDTATITFMNNSGAMQFSFPVRGMGYVQRPRITVRQGDATINPNGEFDFGTVAINESGSITFTIGNTGGANLSAVDSSWVSITGADEELFTVMQQPSSVTNILPSGTANFTIRYSPTEIGANFNALVQINTNSHENGVFVFTVSGSSSDRWPQITVRQDSTVIDPHGQHNFGATLVQTTQTVTFTIENSGEMNMNIFAVDGNRVNLVGNVSGAFATDLQPSATVTPGGTTTFAIRFTPTTIGTSYSATVRIETDSQNDAEFSFTIIGTGRAFAIGDEGPGGGTIFFASGGQFAEVSGELGSFTWGNADITARAHMGGGFTNWRLPNTGELTMMYQNLHLADLGGFANVQYWSNNIIGTWNRSVLHFGTGSITNIDMDHIRHTRAVRTFSAQ